MRNDLQQRLEELLIEGADLSVRVRNCDGIRISAVIVGGDRVDPRIEINRQLRAQREALKSDINRNAENWFLSCVNLVSKLTGSTGPFWEDCVGLREEKAKPTGLSHKTILSMFALLQSIKKESECGLLAEPEYIFAAEAFDDFLEHARSFLGEQKLREASVLASAVLEDAMKKLAKKHAIPVTNDKGLEDMINALTAQGVFRSVKAKKLKACAGVRKHAFHAEWEAVSIDDLRLLIAETDDLLQNYL